MADAREEFSAYIRKYEKSMYAAAYGILKNDRDIADVVQDAILKAYTHLDTLENPDKFRPWIMKIVHNTAIAYIRKRHDEIDIDTQAEILPDSGAPVDSETKITVWNAVGMLKEAHRTVIILFYYEGCTVREIAAITSSAETTVRVRLLRARKELASILKKEDFER